MGWLAEFNWRAYGMILVLVLIGIVFDILTDGIFLSPRNLTMLFRQAAILAVVASGVSLLLLMGEVDLSIGSAVYLAGLSTAIAQVQWEVSTPTAISIALGAGLMLGAWQGACVIWLGVPSFVVTLSGLLGFRGLGYVWSNAATVAPMNLSFVTMSESFIPPNVSLGLIAAIVLIAMTLIVTNWRKTLQSPDQTNVSWRGLLGPIGGVFIGASILTYSAMGFHGLPIPVVIAITIAAILTFLTRSTRFGRYLYAIGGNREASYLSGINIERTILGVFLVMGLIYGLAGIMAAARLDAVVPSTGSFLELEAIAAAVNGGVSLSGGIGAVHGALVGALLLTSIDNGMSLLNVSSFIQLVVKALLLLFAVWFDVTTRSRLA